MTTVRVGTLTAGSVVAHLSARLKEYTNKVIPPDVWYEIMNAKVDMIHELMADKDRAIYKDSATLGAFSGGSKSGGMIPGGEAYSATYANSTKTITLPAENFSNGGFSPDITSALLIPVGSLVIAKVQAGGAYMKLGKVVSTPSATTIIIDNAWGTYAGFDLMVCVFAWDTSDSIKISDEAFYRYIDQILSIYDGTLGDECINAITLANFRGLVKRSLAFNYKNTIIWVRDGEYLYFAKGSGISAYGTRTIYYSRLPYSVTTDTDILDLPKSQNDLFYSVCLLAGLQTLKTPIPQDLKSAENQIAAMKASKEKEIADLLSNKGDN